MEGVLAVVFCIIALIVAAICYGIYSVIGTVGCWILGSIIVAIILVWWILDQHYFYRNTPDWFKEAMASSRWNNKVSRTPLLIREELDDIGLVTTTKGTLEVVIPVFTLEDSLGRYLSLTRERTGYRESLDGCFSHLVYTNIMMIDGIPLDNKKDKQYINALMKHLCRSNGNT